MAQMLGSSWMVPGLMLDATTSAFLPAFPPNRLLLGLE